MQSFAAAQTVALNTKQRPAIANSIPAYDPDLSFCRQMDHSSKDPTRAIYSIDIDKFLKVLNKDDLAPLHQITLGCVQARGSVGMWDVLFNSNNYRPSSGCVLVAQHDFTPVPLNRLVSQTNFLDLNRPASRLHLNALIVGDQIGIAINDPVKKLTHVLLYEVESVSLIRYLRDDTTGATAPLSGVNVVLQHALRMHHDNPEQASLIALGEKEYSPDEAGPFVSWLVDTVHEVKSSYSWKPHFKPIVAQQLKRKIIEQNLQEQIPLAEKISYADFEDMCRALYNEARKNRPVRDNNPPAQSDQKGRGRQQQRRVKRSPDADLPIIQVVRIADNFYVTFDGQVSMVMFTLEDMGDQVITETYLTNKDTIGTVLSEVPGVLILSPSFGDKETLRYFTLNF